MKLQTNCDSDIQSPNVKPFSGIQEKNFFLSGRVGIGSKVTASQGTVTSKTPPLSTSMSMVPFAALPSVTTFLHFWIRLCELCTRMRLQVQKATSLASSSNPFLRLLHFCSYLQMLSDLAVCSVVMKECQRVPKICAFKPAAYSTDNVNIVLHH